MSGWMFSLALMMGCGGDEVREAGSQRVLSGPRSFRLVYSNNVNGEIEPCG